jgi:hypothetical protein
MHANKQIVQNATALLRAIADLADAAAADGDDARLRQCTDALVHAIELVNAITAVLPSDVAPTEVEAPALPPALFPAYDPRTKRWKCAKCRGFTSTSKRSVSHHMRTCTSAPEPLPLTCPKCRRTFESNVQLRGHLGWCGKRSTVLHICIAPGCRCRAKGPRFHFLCEKHRRATTRQILRWRYRRKAAVAAAAAED